MDRKLLNSLNREKSNLLEMVTLKEYGALKNKKIIILEDDIEAMLYLKRVIFREFRVNPEAFLNVAEAISSFLVSPPDLIFIDVELDNKFGTDVYDALTLLTAESVPVIFISKNQNYKEVIDLNNSKISFLSKPINTQSLIRRVEEVLFNRRTKVV